LDPQQTNEILTAIVDGIKTGRPEPTRLAAVKALQNSLDFCSENFAREVERNMLMTVVCEATQSTDSRVRSASFECVCRVAELYYEHLNQGYMDALYPMTVNAIATDSEEVAMMAVEFWSTLCEVEMNLDDDVENFGYVSKVMQHLMPTLLVTLEKQSDDLDDDDWNLAGSAASCIGLIANACEDEVVGHVLPYVSGNAGSPDWRKREAAIMAFGQILEGPTNEQAMAGVVQQALQLLVTSLVDQNDVVKDTSAWTLGRVAGFSLYICC
jgi:importin subunit beta-1